MASNKNANLQVEPGKLIPLSDIVETNPRTTISHLLDDDLVSFVSMADVSERGKLVSPQIRRLAEVQTGFTVFSEGDTLFAKITPCTENGKGCIATELVNGVGFGSTEFHVLRPKNDAYARFVYQISLTPSARHKAASMMGGSAGQQRVPSDFASHIFISEAAVENFRSIVSLLDAFDDAIEATRAVIEQTRKLKTALLNDMFSNGTKPKPGRKNTHSAVGEFPSHWQMKSLRDVCLRINDGVHQSVRTAKLGVPFLYVSCVRNNKIYWDDAAKISDESYAEISRGREPCVGGVLYTVVGSYGHAAMLHDSRPFSFQRHIAYLIPNRSSVIPDFICLWLNSESGKTYADKVALGNAQKTITLTELAAFPIPVPPLHEQTEIVSVMNGIEEFENIEDRRLNSLLDTKAALSHGLLSGSIPVEKIRTGANGSI